MALQPGDMVRLATWAGREAYASCNDRLDDVLGHFAREATYVVISAARSASGLEWVMVVGSEPLLCGWIAIDRVIAVQHTCDHLQCKPAARLGTLEQR